MRLLILSDVVYSKQHRDEPLYPPPYDIRLDVGNHYYAGLSSSIFDYDVSIVHITEPRNEGEKESYFQNISKIFRDSSIALEHGRTVICLPHSGDFAISEVSAYKWLKGLQVGLLENLGEDIRPSGAGRAQVIQDYLKYAPKYYQVVMKPEYTPQSTLAVVDDTEIVVGLQHQFGKGTLVILPPPLLDNGHYTLTMSNLARVARHYYERAQRSVAVGDAPDWLERFLVARAKDLSEQINELAKEKTKFDRIAYVLYGTGDELESSVALLLEQLGLNVELQSKGANIDLKAKYPKRGIGFAVEVTGTKGTIQKDSKKIAQAWQYLSDRVGTPEETNRLIIVANTQYHLDPRERTRESFSKNVVKLLGSNEVLLITTLQLYEQWKEVHEGNKSAEDLIQELYSKFGLYKSTTSS
jgi:hypothetical protein